MPDPDPFDLTGLDQKQRYRVRQVMDRPNLTKAKRRELVTDLVTRLRSSDLEQRAIQARTDAKWEEAAARLSPGAAVQRPPVVKEDRREAMHVENAQRASAREFRRVLDTACPAHGVSPGEPCWWQGALCGVRIRRAGFVGKVSRHSGAGR